MSLINPLRPGSRVSMLNHISLFLSNYFKFITITNISRPTIVSSLTSDCQTYTSFHFVLCSIAAIQSALLQPIPHCRSHLCSVLDLFLSWHDMMHSSGHSKIFASIDFVCKILIEEIHLKQTEMRFHFRLVNR